MLQFLEATGANANAMGGFTTIIMIVVMLGVMYFLMIRPENKRKKEAEQVKDNKFVIETGADQVRIEFMKWALSTNETGAERAKEEAKKAAEARAKAKAEKAAEKNKR